MSLNTMQHHPGGGGGDRRLAVLLLLHLFSSISAAAAPPPISYPLSSTDGVPTLTIYVGSPPLPFTVSLQTASDLSWIPCPSNSTTFAAVPCFSPDLCFSSPFVSAPFPPSSCRSLSDTCRFRSSASPLPFNVDLFSFDFSTILSGHISFDDFYLSSSDPPPTNASLRRPIAFGCATSARTAAGPPSPPPLIGALGLSPGHYSFPSQILRNDPASVAQRFAYCLSGGNATASNVSAAGALHLGAYKLPPASLLEALSYSRFQYPRSTSTDTRYYAMVDTIEVDDGETAPFVIDPSGVAAAAGEDLPVHVATFDTGSPYTKLPTQIYRPIFRELERLTSVTNPMAVSDGVGDALCYSGHLSQVSAIFPQVRFRFHGGAVLETGAESLLQVSAGGGSDGDDPIYCLSIRDAGQNSGNITVIGRHQQRNHWIEFDLLGRRVGIAKADCSQAL